MKLKKQFKDFIEAIKLTSEANDLITKRETLQNDFKSKFPENCKNDDITINKSDLRFIDQGSYKIGTTIKNPDGSVDRDVAVIFPLDISVHDDPRVLKKHARDALKIENVRIPKIKEPCITVGYHKKEDEYLHIDFPMYAQHNDCLYLARGKEHSDSYSWEEADPEGLNDYFIDQFKDNDQLRRTIRYIKKWKLEKYASPSSSHEVPPSIGLTLLACDYFTECKEDDVHDDLTALFKTMENILNSFTLTKDSDGKITKAEIVCDLPTIPFTDVFYKMKSSDAHGVLFYNRLDKAVGNLRDACNVESEHDAGVYVQKVLGDKFDVPAKAVAASVSMLNKKEHNFG